jgi:hypothetical protein
MKSKISVHDFKSCLANQTGQSLIQVLVGIAIMGVMTAVFTSMMASQNRETRALSEKLAALDFQNLLQTTLSEAEIVPAGNL